MKSGKKQPDESIDFKAAMADVQPLAEQNRIAPHIRKPPPAARQRELDEQAVIGELLSPLTDPADLETGEELLYLRSGHPPKLLRRLRRGHFSVTRTVDLHHMDKNTARDVLLDFIEHSVQAGHGCVRVIHGKGLRSRNEPVLKLMTRRLLSRHSNVVAFASCRPVDGGTGAVNVLLRQKNGRRK